MQKIIEIKGGVVRHPQMRMGAPIDFELLAGEQLAIVGDNGSLANPCVVDLKKQE